MRYLIYLILWAGGLQIVFGQEKVIEGMVIIDMEEMSPEGVYVTNKRTNKTTVTDALGGFSIRAVEGDQLLIRSSFYESRIFNLTENVMRKEFITIHLSLQVVALDEAVITQQLTGYLDKDVKYNPSKDRVAKLYRELGINPDVDKLRDSADFSFGRDVTFTTLNVEKMLEVFTGDLRRRQNLYEFEGREYKIKKIQDYFGEDYFVNDLNIPKEKIREFVFFSYESTRIPLLFDSGNYLGIMQELNQSSKIYLNRLEKWMNK